MLPLEHSAILLACIKQQLVLKTICGLYESGHFTQVLLYTFQRANIKENKSDLTDEQADFNLCCLHATMSGFLVTIPILIIH